MANVGSDPPASAVDPTTDPATAAGPPRARTHRLLWPAARPRPRPRTPLPPTPPGPVLSRAGATAELRPCRRQPRQHVGPVAPPAYPQEEGLARASIPRGGPPQPDNRGATPGRCQTLHPPHARHGTVRAISFRCHVLQVAGRRRAECTAPHRTAPPGRRTPAHRYAEPARRVASDDVPVASRWRWLRVSHSQGRASCSERPRSAPAGLRRVSSARRPTRASARGSRAGSR